MKFVIPLPPVTKKNSQDIFINRTTGKPFIAPSKAFKEYQATAGYYLKCQGVRAVDADKYPVNIKAVFYMPTRRRCDLTNLLEALDDVLTHYGIIADDDFTHVAAHDGSRVRYDKENPRTEIVINRITDRQRAKWLTFESDIYTGGGYTKCEACGENFAWGNYFEVSYDFYFCPNCGARMLTEKEGANNET